MSNICKFIDADGSLRQILIYRNVCYSNPLTRKLVNVLFLKLFLQILRKQHWTSCIKLIVCLENLLKYWQTHAICSLYISEKFSFPQTLFNPYSFFGFSTTFMNKINTKRILWSFLCDVLLNEWAEYLFRVWVLVHHTPFLNVTRVKG